MENTAAQSTYSASSPQTGNQNKKIVFVVGIFILVLLGLTAIKSLFFSLPRTITIIGEGKVTIPADKAVILAAFISRNSSRDALVTNATRDVDALVNELQGTGLVTVSKSSPQITPVQAGIDGSFSNFEYRQGFQITVNNKDSVSQVMSLLSSKNVVIAQTTYLPNDEAAAKAQLLQAAITDAQARAKELGKTGSFGIGKIINVSEVSPGSAGTVLSSQAGAAAGTAGYSDIEMNTAVSVTFGIR